MTASTGDPAATTAGRGSPTEAPQGDIPADTFALRLVMARHHAGRLSIEKAAERCGLNSENWRRWEDGGRPRDKEDVAYAVAEGLRMNFMWLLLGGPLLPARGRLTKRAGGDTVRYRRRSVRTTAGRLSGRPRRASSEATTGRYRTVDRTQPVAA